MAVINLPFESLLSDSGINQLKGQLDQLISNPSDTAEMVLEHLRDNADLPIKIPVSVSKESTQYVIETVQDLATEEFEFFLQDLESVLKEFNIKLNETTTAIEELIFRAESQLLSIRDRVSDELVKIPYEIGIRDNNGTREFFITQTGVIEGKVHGVNMDLKESELSFTASMLSGLSLDLDVLMPELNELNNAASQPINLKLDFASGIFTGTASNLPPARLQGIKANLTQLTLVIQDGDFQSGTQMSGAFEFDFLDGSTIDFSVELLNNGDVRYQAQNPEGQELKKGSVSVFFEKIEVRTHTDSPADVDIMGWFQLPGLVDSATDESVKTDFQFAYLDPYFEFTGKNFQSFPLGFGSLTFDEVHLEIHKNGTLRESSWLGQLSLPFFSDGVLDFEVTFENTPSNRFKLSASNPASQPLRHGGFELNFQQFELIYENDKLQDVDGAGELRIPQFTNGAAILVTVNFNRVGNQENLTIEATDFGTPEVAGCQIDFAQIRFDFVNNTFSSSQINGSLSLPHSNEGTSVGFQLEIENGGEDYSILLSGDPQTQILRFETIELLLTTFELKIVGRQLSSVEGSGKLKLPGLSQAFDFSFDTDISGPNVSYHLEVNNVEAEIQDFKLTFDRIRLEIEKGQSLEAEAVGSLVLPVFEEDGQLSFEVEFGSESNYLIKVDGTGELVKFGDFELKEASLDLEIEGGVLKDFEGEALLRIPGFEEDSAVVISYTQSQDRYQIQLENPLDVNLFDGSVELESLNFVIQDGSFEEGLATGKFQLPANTGGAGIQFQLVVDQDGKGYQLAVQGDPDQNQIEFGVAVLKFDSFNLKVKNGDLENLSGAGAMELPLLQPPSFAFQLTIEQNGSDSKFVIEVNNLGAELESFSLFFEKIRFESLKTQNQFNFDSIGELELPVFDGDPIDFSMEIGDEFYVIALSGPGQSANFGIFVLSDLDFDLRVQDGQLTSTKGSAKFFIPEITPEGQPFTVEVDYSKNGDEIFKLEAEVLPPVDLAIFTLEISELGFTVRNKSFDEASISGTLGIPVFDQGGELDFSFEVEDEGNSYKIKINSVGPLTGNGLVLDEVDFELIVLESGLQSLSGGAKFELPGGDEPVEVDVNYSKPENKLAFVASAIPTFQIGGIDFTFSKFGFAIVGQTLTDAEFEGNLKISACEPGHDELFFEFELTDGNNYTIKANPDGQKTELKLGDISLFIENFDLEILAGELESITANAGLGFPGFEAEDSSDPAEIAIDFSYQKSSNLYQIGVTQDQKIKFGGFAFTIKTLDVSFTPDSLQYPFTFEGELEIPGLKDESDQQAKVEVSVEVTSQDDFSGSIASGAVFYLGNVKISITKIAVSKEGEEVTVELEGELELEGLTGANGQATALKVAITIDNQGAFEILGEINPSTNALKVVDVPSVVSIYLNKIKLSRTSTNDWDFGLGGLIENQIVIPGMDNLLPSEINLKDLQFGSAFDIDLDIRWPSGLNISFGGAQSEALIPVNGKFGNAVSLDALKISFKDNGAAGVDLGVAFSGASITLGPVAASVEGLGIEATLTKATFSNGSPQGNANFGIVNIDIRFKPPTGLGVSLETPVFTGGGYLFFDNEKGEYAGAVELSFMNLFAVSAIGLINSKMPDGKPGTSVLFIVSVEFGTGIALGFGFFLSGLGGILGIHRTIQVERLRDGVRSGTIQNILFPKDIIANINKILTDIKEVFPVKRDQFVLGPMAAITWGVPTILRVDLGLVIEFANPVRFGILGVLRVILPDENVSLIKIQVAFLGLIDFEKGMLSFDASLFDSKVLTFGLEGDMVLRISWGEKPDFVLSVGGFHPRFEPPTHLQIPTMKRMTLKILSGNPRLTLTCYFAVTSNTVQFGAGIDFYFGVAGFKVVGEFGFDVLFQFSPFRFIADARARLAVMAGSTELLSLSLEFSLEGPAPWRAKGTAKFKVLFFSVKVKFDVTWGDKRDTSLPDIEVFPLLLEALEDSQNWRSITQSVGSSGLRMKALSDEGELILTPNGSIEISQKIVPLNVEISKFGQFKPADYSQFEISEISIGSSDLDPSFVHELFASANFVDLPDNEKLSLPSFNPQDSGVSLKAGSELSCGKVTNRLVQYEEMVMDEVNTQWSIVKENTFSLPKIEGAYFSKNGAIAQSKLSAKRTKIHNLHRVELNKPAFAVASTEDLTALPNQKQMTYIDAMNVVKSTPKKGARSIQVVSSDILEL